MLEKITEVESDSIKIKSIISNNLEKILQYKIVLDNKS